MGSQCFDSEGVKSEALKLVKNGFLKNYLVDTYNGKKLDLKSNGRSGGCTNLYFENGQTSFEELLKINSKNLYITETIGHGTNLVTGDYSVGATGFLVQNGELKYPVSEITIAGNFKDMFKNMTLANDLDFKYSVNSPHHDDRRHDSCWKMSNFCVIGSGISGATIANLLSKNHSVDLFDKARGPGGRSSFKRLDRIKGFDHGMQYISPKSLLFKIFIQKLIKKKILKNWNGKHIFLNRIKKEKKDHIKIIGRKGNNDINKYLLKNINCKFQTELKKIVFKKKKWVLTFSDGKKKFYEKVILTCPFAQLLKLTKNIIKNPFIKKKLKWMQILL